LHTQIQELIDEASKVLLGKEQQLRVALSAFLSGGHLLIEDIPGMGKTTLVHVLGRLLGLKVSRIQFTNDLLPGDILGTSIFNRAKSDFEFRPGPIFAQMVLADELNRASPKTQSALLQVMEEQKVTIDGEEYPMNDGFTIIATQNPMQQIGTYPLPESQLDRFMLSMTLGFPSREFERQILLSKDIRKNLDHLLPILDIDQIKEMQDQVTKVKVSDALLDYVLDLLEKGRDLWSEGQSLSPRSGKDLVSSARAHAYIEGRDFVLPDDIQALAPNVFGHRLGAERGVVHGINTVKELLERVAIP
jgi:MoxR-like ATPase